MSGNGEIALGDMNAVEEAVNEYEISSGSQTMAAQRAGQKPYTRMDTTDILRAVHFRSLGEHWKSLPTVSKLFMFVTFIDVAMVFGYVIWQSIEMGLNDDSDHKDGAKREEHLHVILGMFITAVFLVVFVLEAIYKENDFELFACLLLVTVIAIRVIYFVTSAGYNTWQQALAIAIVSTETVLTLILGLLTYNRFGWRIYSQLACDLRVKNAEERTIIYFAENRFATLVKLDFQFLVLTAVMGIVMSVQANDISITNDTSTLLLFIFTIVGFLIGLPWLIASYYCVRTDQDTWAKRLGFLCPFTFPPPIAAVVAVYSDGDSKKRDANESLTISTVLLVIIRLAVLYYMIKLMSVSATKRDPTTKKDVAEKSEFRLKFRMSNKNPDLLPLLKGSWLMKQSGPNQYRRRFFQLSQDNTTLRWAWNSYVVLFYVEELVLDDEQHILTLNFEMEPELVMKFESAMEYEAWKRGFETVLPLLMAPDTNIHQHSSLQHESRHKRMKPGTKDQGQGLTVEAILNKFGILRTTRHGIRRSQHPLRDAEKEWKRKVGSKHTPTTPLPLAEQLSKQPTAEEGLTPRSSRIPTGKNFPIAISSQTDNSAQQSYNSQGETEVDDGNPSGPEGEGMNSVQALLGGMQNRVDTIDYHELLIGKFLGAGAEGSVYAAWYLDTPVAVKQTNSVHELEMTLCAGQHDNVVGLRGIAKEGSSTYIILEYCPRGTLDLLLHHTMNAGRWDPSKVFSMIRCIARGLVHLHSRKPAILHRDIKPANVFVSHGLVLKIGDFGMSRQLKPLAETKDHSARPRLRRTLTPNVIGTANYSAPELLDERLQSDEYDIDRLLKADVYSFGVTMWEIVQRERPFEGMQLYEIVTEWSQGDGVKLSPFDISKDLSLADQYRMSALQELVFECTEKMPDRRPTMRAAVRRLKEIDNEVQRRSMPESQV